MASGVNKSEAKPNGCEALLEEVPVERAIVTTEAGFDLLPGSHPITPVMFPGEDGARQATMIADHMLGNGVYVIAFSFPVVPKGKARIRVQLSAAHSEADVRAGRIGEVPAHLRDAHYPGAKAHGHGQAYRYAHDHPHGVAAQQYLPDELAGVRYYHPTDHGNEAQIAERWQVLRGLLGRAG